MVVLESGNSTDAVRIKHGYDRAGSRTYREQTVDSNSNFDEVYRYDGVDRLASTDRGPLAAQKTSVSPLKFSQCWNLDATGNWRDFREDNDGVSGWNLVQTRTHNAVNEISDILETSGPSWITPLYDRAGNMTRVPKPSDPTQYYSCTYDAWNRLVKLQDGANTVAEYRYDGAKRRIVKKSYSGGSLAETRHLYFTEPSQWQVLEERVGSSTAADRQFVWGMRYIDDLVLRDRNADSNVNTGSLGLSGSGLEERLYCLQDANWNVTAISNASGTIQERYAYSAYGTPIFLTSSFGSRASSSYDWESLYCGYRYDTLVGQFHIRRRVHAPGLGWLSRDPIAYGGGEPNLYRYCVDSPILYVDPSGLACVTRSYPSRTWVSENVAYLGSFVLRLTYAITQAAGTYTVCDDACCANGMRGMSAAFDYSAHVVVRGSIGASWQWNGLLGLGVLNAGVTARIFAQGEGDLNFGGTLTYCPPSTLGGVVKACGNSFSLTVGGEVTAWARVIGYDLFAGIVGSVTYPARFCASVDVGAGTISGAYAEITGPGVGGILLYGHGRGIGFNKRFKSCLLGDCSKIVVPEN